MAFLDFLKRKSNGHAKTLDAQRAEVNAALATIAQERSAAQALLDSHESLREQMLRDDAPDVAIKRLDEEGDLQRIKIERLDVYETEINARLSELDGADAEVEWRRLFEEWRRDACDFASSFNSTLQKRSESLRTTAAAQANSIARRYGLVSEPVPFILNGENLQNFVREIERLSDIEARRREAVERRQEG
jgi:hypothetical protein